jgi:hypothetical protein
MEEFIRRNELIARSIDYRQHIALRDNMLEHYTRSGKIIQIPF